MLPHGWFHHTVRTATVFFFILMECQAGKRALNEEDQVLEDPCFDWPVQYDNLEEYDERFPFYVHDPSSTRLIPDEQRLLNKVFRTYDNSVRPVYNATSNVVVKFGLTLIQIMDMDVKNQVLVTNVWLEHEWVDERIRWDPDEYSGLHVIRIPANKLWLPDIVLYNNADDFTNGYMETNVMVYSDGTIFWPPPGRLRCSCKADITFFPFDMQECKMKFGSWSYAQAQVDIINRSSIVDMTNYVSNGEWELARASVQRNEVVYPISPAVYPDVTFTFIIHRRILYYIFNILAPCAWLNVLSLLTFCLPPDSGEKVSLGITVMLSYSVFMLLVAENMPPTSEFVPLIGIYLTISMAVTSISVIFTVCVLNIHHRGAKAGKVPRWMKRLICGTLADLLRCRYFKTAGIDKKYQMQKMSTKYSSNTALRLMDYGSRVDIRSTRLSTHMNGAHGNYPATGHTSTKITNINTYDIEYEEKQISILEDISTNVKTFVDSRKADEKECAAQVEWQEAASVLDRLLFIVFMLGTVIFMSVILFILPLHRHYVDNADIEDSH